MNFTEAAIWIFIFGIVLACIAVDQLFDCVVDHLFPTSEQEMECARVQVEEMLKRANQEAENRPRMRARTQI